MKDLYNALHELVHLFERRSISYVLIGGFAVRAYAFPRNTGDLDFTISIDPQKMPSFIEDLRELGYRVPEAYGKRCLDRVSSMPILKARLFMEGRGIDADIFIADSPYQHEMLKRRIRDQVEDFEVWMVTPEDLVLLKLLADRPRDRIDVDDLLFSLGQLDESYMRKWAKEIDVADRLDKALHRHGSM